MNVRDIALKLLGEYEERGKYVNLSLNSHMTDKLTAEERSFLTALLYTAVERKLTLDYWISSLSGRGIDSIDPTTRNIIRLGLSQIVHFERIPDFAAVNETVKLARNKGEASFVNGVLRAAVRAKGELPLPDEKKNYPRYLSVKYSFPLWIVKYFIKRFGTDKAEAQLVAFNSGERYTDLTVNTLKITVSDFIGKLEKEGIAAEVSPICDISVRIPYSVNPQKLPGYADGWFFVQDSSCAASVSAIEIERGMSVADVCACPGGKSFVAALLLENEGVINSFDLHESKLSLITSGAERLGIKIIKAQEKDATLPTPSLADRFDRVICDVPCSGLGVLGKKPDIRYKSEESVKELPELQLAILRESAGYLKTGGYLLYSTCTLVEEENECVVRAFLSEHPDFEPVDFEVGDHHSADGMMTFLPSVHSTDGFFAAKLRKIR